MFNHRVFSLILSCFFVFSASSVKADESFGAFLAQFHSKALADGVSAQTLEKAFADIEILERVIELDRKQPEGTISFETYRERILSRNRISQGRRLYRKHRKILDKIGEVYGVQPRFIVALWGVETHYGKITGGFNVIEALATLAHDGRRSDFFAGELIHALHIIDEGHITAKKMLGSWAGALGQCQFMPSSFRRLAVDFNMDGKRDIWGTLPDVFASSAHYLMQAGWDDELTWGREVKLPRGFDAKYMGLDTTKTLTAWGALGVRKADGRKLPARANLQASIVRPDGDKGPAYLIYDNYRVLRKWNKSHYFAISVGLLSDAIAR